MSRRTRLAAVLLAALFAADGAVATDGFTGSEPGCCMPGFVNAKLIGKSEPPTYPRIELNAGREGWVRISYVIDTKGVPTGLFVEASNGIERFERRALEWAADLRYEPATLNGIPVAQARNGYRITFGLGEITGLTRQFKKHYQRAHEALVENRLGDAEVHIATAAARPSLNLREEAWLATLSGRLCQAREQLECMLEAFADALAYGGESVDADVLRAVAQAKLVAELKASRFAEARRTYTSLAGLIGEETAEAQFTAAMERMDALIASADPIQLEGMLNRPGAATDGPGIWSFEPVRRRPALLEVEGAVKQLQVRCSAYSATIEPQAGRAWRLPEEWRKCHLYFFGDPGTTILVEEMPVAAVTAEPVR